MFLVNIPFNSRANAGLIQKANFKSYFKILLCNSLSVLPLNGNLPQTSV